MTRVRVDAEALAQWSGALEGLPRLADEVAVVAPPVAGLPAVVGSPAAAALDGANSGALRALAEAARSFDSLVAELQAAVLSAMAGYVATDEQAASVMDDQRVR